jgi:transcriptional regulator with PAS, ATPase and Fis domain
MLRAVSAPGTIDDEEDRLSSRPASPCAVLVHQNRTPTFRVVPLSSGRIVLGRGSTTPFDLEDARISREHAEVRFDGARWHVRDLGSHNGTFVDTKRVLRAVSTSSDPVVRIGHAILFFARDGTALEGDHQLEDREVVAGPALHRAFESVARAARSDVGLLLTGESGTGKEIAAGRYHDHGPFPDGPLIDVNCATIPEGLAERLLFGARKGAYSGATSDVEGFVQSATRGVLFLDEVGTLDLEVQAKLLRVLETRQVAPLGATSARPIDFRVVCATNRDLRKAIGDGHFRADLFFRLAQEQVVLPPLRERREEIPYLVALQIARCERDLVPSARFVEACLSRAWPGNVRELLLEVRKSVERARDADDRTIHLEHLGETAGTSFAADEASTDTDAPPDDDPRRDEILAALRKSRGNVAEVAREMGVHRTQLYRLMKKLGIEQKWD